MQQYAIRHNVELTHEVSAKTNQGVSDAFQQIVQKLDEKKDEINNNRLTAIQLGGSRSNKGLRKKKKCKC